MQFLAMLTMLIDHIGAVWFPDQFAYRIIGRLSLPFYAYVMVLGYYRTSNMKRYLARVGLLALLSQLPFMMAFNTKEINVIGTLFAGLLLMRLLDRWSGNIALQLCAAAAALTAHELVPIDYGAYAVLLMLIYRYVSVQWMVALHLLLNMASIFAKGWVLQMFSLFTTVMIVYLPQFTNILDKIRIPRMLWRSFYPAHLAIIAIISGITN